MGLFGSKKKKLIEVYAPLSGKAVAISDVPDAVFSQKMVGDGIAIIPGSGKVNVVAPVSGEIIQIFPTGHAFGIRTDEGLEMLVHLGLETVELNGEGFEIVGVVGSKVKAGDLVIVMDTDYVLEHKCEIISPVVIVNMHQVKALEIKTVNANVVGGETLVYTVELDK